MNLQQLQRVLIAYHRGKATRATSAMQPFKVWSNACGSTDVKTMLQQPAAPLQALQKHKANTAAWYLSNVLAVLRMPAVAALLPPSETAALLQQLQEPMLEYRRLHSLSQRTPHSATAAIAQFSSGADHHHHNHRRRQQQQQQQDQAQQQELTAHPQPQSCDPAASVELEQLQKGLEVGSGAI
jgi:hypothetical protein